MPAAEARLQLDPDPTSPARARAFISKALREWGCDHVEEVATLLVSEVVTNAVCHVNSPAVLSARHDEDGVVVRVQDESDRLPTLQPAQSDDESGRGLMIVDALADHWGVEPLADGGKAVYFALKC